MVLLPAASAVSSAVLGPVLVPYGRVHYGWKDDLGRAAQVRQHALAVHLAAYVDFEVVPMNAIELLLLVKRIHGVAQTLLRVLAVVQKLVFAEDFLHALVLLPALRTLPPATILGTSACHRPMRGYHGLLLLPSKAFKIGELAGINGLVLI